MVIFYNVSPYNSVEMAIKEIVNLENILGSPKYNKFHLKSQAPRPIKLEKVVIYWLIYEFLLYLLN